MENQSGASAWSESAQDGDQGSMMSRERHNDLQGHYAVLTLTLATIFHFGVWSYSVSQRDKEPQIFSNCSLLAGTLQELVLCQADVRSQYPYLGLPNGSQEHKSLVHPLLHARQLTRMPTESKAVRICTTAVM